LYILVIGDAQPDSDQIALSLSFGNDLLRSLGRHSSNRRKKLPLVGVWVEVGVNEHAVARLAWHKLQGERNQVPEPSLRHGVLVGEKAIVGIETELMPAFHGSRENQGSQFARGYRWQRTIKEDPNVTALPGTRTLQGSRYIQLMAGLKKSLSVIFPSLLVEVHRKKPARFLGQERIHANDLLAQEVVFDDGIGDRKEFPCLLVDFLPLLRAALVDGLPVPYGRRYISVLAFSVLPSPCIHILSPTKQASKQRNSLSGAFLLVHWWRRLDGFGWKWILRRQLRYRDAVNRQKPSQTGILFAEANILLLGLEWKRF